MVYTLEEAADELEIKVGELLRMAAAGKLALLTLYNGLFFTGDYATGHRNTAPHKGWAAIPPEFLGAFILYDVVRDIDQLIIGDSQVQLAIVQPSSRNIPGDRWSGQPGYIERRDDIVRTTILRSRGALAVEVKEVERLKAELLVKEPEVRPASGQGAAKAGVTVTIPHMNKALDAIFQVMRRNWEDFDPASPPKQTNIAFEIDDAMDWGNKGGRSKGPSRNAKAIASILKPDNLNE